MTHEPNRTTLLDDLQAAIDTLASTARALGHLPAPHMYLSPNHPNRLELGIHNNLAVFEAWREALDIPAGAVAYSQLPGLMCLQAETAVGRAEVVLNGYAPLVTPATTAYTWAGVAA